MNSKIELPQFVYENILIGLVSSLELQTDPSEVGSNKGTLPKWSRVGLGSRHEAMTHTAQQLGRTSLLDFHFPASMRLSEHCWKKARVEVEGATVIVLN